MFNLKKKHFNYYVMKRIICALAILAAALSLDSCETKAHLANEIEGTWAGTPQSITDNSALTATLLETFQFVKIPAEDGGESTGGTVNIVGMLSSSIQLVGDNDFEQPLTFTSSARSSIVGSWQAIDDEEIVVTLNPNTLTVVVDPDAVVPGSALLSESSQAKIEQMKPDIINMIASGLKQSLSNRYSSVKLLDDVEIDGPVLKFEIGKANYVFNRQGGSK